MDAKIPETMNADQKQKNLELNASALKEEQKKGEVPGSAPIQKTDTAKRQIMGSSTVFRRNVRLSQRMMDAKAFEQRQGGPVRADTFLPSKYEMQPPGSNNCFACTAAALYNQHLFNTKGRGVPDGELLSQYQVRAFMPDYVSFDEYKELQGEANLEETFHSYLENIDKIDLFAHPESHEMGNIYEMADLFLQEFCVYTY